MNRIKMKEIIKTFGVFLVVAVVACGLVLPQQASAALPAPNFMPGFPMLAGPQIIIMWSPIPGAVKYNIYMNGKKVAGSMAMQYMAPAPTAGGEYKFQVAAVGADGAESPMSAEGKITIILVEPPTGLTALPQLDRIPVRWAPAKGAVIYDVFRRKKGEPEFTMISSVTEGRFEDTQIEVGVEYEYAIKSKDSTGKASDYSEILMAKLQEQTKKEESKNIPLRLLPTSVVGRMELAFSPFDVAVTDEIAVISGSTLLLLPDVNEIDEFSLEPLLAEGQDNGKGYSGIFLTEDGETLYASQNNPPRILVIDMGSRAIEKVIDLAPYKPQKGELAYGTEDNRFQRTNTPLLFDLVVDFDGNIIVSDNGNQRLMAFDQDGEFLGTLGWNESGEYENLVNPAWYVPAAGMVSSPADGEVYVASIFSIYGYTWEGEKLAEFGTAGNTVGNFGKASGMANDHKGHLVVSDSRNMNIQIFRKNPEDGEWEFLYLLANKDKKKNAQVALTLGMAFTPDDKRFFAAEPLNKTVTVLDVLWDQADAVEPLK